MIIIIIIMIIIITFVLLLINLLLLLFSLAPGSPINLTSAANQSKSIVLAWAEPPLGQHNGILSGYVVEYWAPDVPTKMINSSVNIIFISQLLLPGVTYSLKVAAFTRAGRGNFSDIIQQMTIATPPMIPAGGFQVDPDDSTSTTTFTVTLPDIASNEFR